MAESKVKGSYTQESACTNILSGLSVNSNKLTKVNQLNMVHIEFAVASSSTIPVSTAIATIPSGYAAPGGKVVPAIIFANNGNNFAGSVVITSSGTIQQDITSNCQKIYVDGWYTL